MGAGNVTCSKTDILKILCQWNIILHFGAGHTVKRYWISSPTVFAVDFAFAVPTRSHVSITPTWILNETPPVQSREVFVLLFPEVSIISSHCGQFELWCLFLFQAHKTSSYLESMPLANEIICLSLLRHWYAKISNCSFSILILIFL